MSTNHNYNQYKFKVPYRLYDYQKEAILFSLEKGNAILNLMTGSGKTFIAIGTAFVYLKRQTINKAIFVCTKKSKKSIKEDLGKTDATYLEIKDLESFIKFLSQDEIRLGVITYEIKDKIIEIINPDTNNIRINQTLLELWEKQNIILLIDEIHKLRNQTSLTTVVFKRLIELSKHVCGYTATSFMSKLTDIFYMVHLLNPYIFGSLEIFENKFIIFRKITTKQGYQIKLPAKFKNLKVLSEILRKYIMYFYFPLKDVQFKENYIELTEQTKNEYTNGTLSLQEVIKENQEKEKKKTEIKEQIELEQMSSNHEKVSELLEELDNEDLVESNVKFTNQMIQVQYLVDKDPNKVNELLRLIDEKKEKGIVLYVSYYATLDFLKEKFNELKIQYTEINGKVSDKKLDQNIKWFKDDPTNKVCIITDAGSASLNLQFTNELILYNMPIPVGKFIQVLGRIVRLGSKYDQFNISLILTNDTIDYYKYQYVMSYKETYSQIFSSNLQMPNSLTTLPNFNAYFLKKLRNKNLWNNDKKLFKEVAEKDLFIDNTWKPKRK